MTQPEDTLITSARNPLVKRIRALGHREARRTEDRIVIEGLRAIIEAVRVRLTIETMLYAEERVRSDIARATLADAEKRGATLVAATPEVLDSLSERDASQGIVAVAQRPHADFSAIPTKGSPLVMAVYEPQDPGNVGTTARIADGAGAAALVIFGKKSTDPFDPKAIRASMGSIFSLPIIEMSDTAAALAALQARKLRLVGAAGAGAKDLWHTQMAGSVALLMGNERAGLPPEVIDACDAVARIPMQGHADSLNVAAAAAIFAFEAVRQRRVEQGNA
jgi:TrmH family RNA methyltransferase